MNLLINEPPLQVLPSLAKVIGLNEAIIVQQIHYWTRISKNVRDGETWVYKTFLEWQEEFPFWSEKTIKRAMKRLEEKSLVISTSKYNRMGIDRTKWYRINYPALSALPSGQNDPMVGTKCPDTKGQNDPMDKDKMTLPITREYTENTQEKKNSHKQVYDDASDEMLLVDFFIKMIRKNSPSFKTPNKQSWADMIRKLMQIDGRDKKEIAKVIQFVQSDSFEKSNVLSPVKLRKRYDSLLIKMNEQQKKLQPQQIKAAAPVARPAIDLSAGEE